MIVDLRSDTVTKPSAGMLKAMLTAHVGDDVWGDDPTVAELYRVMRELTGKEAALFFPSGTQSNLTAVLAHCGRGDEVILGRDAHIYTHEVGGAAALGGVSYCPLDNLPDGSLSQDAIQASIRPDDIHYARTALLCLENTIGGKVLPEEKARQAVALARQAGLAVHLDGARLWNASIASGTSLRALCEPFDTVSLCFSKGMGTPAGTVLVGSETLIRKAVRLRKMLGGGMRQTGILAAACLYALDNNFERLAEDHRNAERLAGSLRTIGQLSNVQQATNIVFVDVPESSRAALSAFLAEREILVSVGPTSRLVTNLGVTEQGTEQVITAFREFYAART